MTIEEPPRFFASATHSDVVFLCDEAPSAVVARRIGDREVEMTILGARLVPGSSGVFRTGLKPRPPVPQVKSVRVFSISPGDVSAAILLASPATGAEAMTLKEPARVVLRLFGPPATGEEGVDGITVQGEGEQGSPAGNRVAERPAAPKGRVVAVAAGGARRKPAPQAAGRRAVKAAAASKSRAPSRSVQEETGAAAKKNHEEKALKKDPPSEPSPTIARVQGVHSAPPEAAAAVVRSAKKMETKASRPDVFPYRLSRIAGVQFFWPNLDSPFYQADAEAKRIGEELREAATAEETASPAAALLGTPGTPAAFFLAADLSLVQAAPSGHLLDTIAMYRRALRSVPGWPDSRRALANILSCYVAIGFEAEALGVVRELRRGGAADALASFAVAAAAGIEQRRGHPKKVRELLSSLGQDRKRAESCFGAIIRGQLVAGTGKKSEAIGIMSGIAEHCPEAIKEDPDTALLLGRLRSTAGEPAQALELLEKLDGMLASRWEKRELAWAIAGAREQAGDAQGARRALEEIAAGKFGASASNRAELELAEYKAREGKSEEALRLLARVYVKSGGKLGRQAAQKAAGILGKQGRIDEAATELIKLAQKPGKVADLAQNRAERASISSYGIESAFAARQYRQVIEAYARSPAPALAGPESAEQRWMVGKSYLELGLEQEAARVLRDALAGVTGELRVRTLKDLITAVLAEKRYEEAERLADEMLRQPLDAVDGSWARLAKARAAAGLGRKERALALLGDGLKGASTGLEAEIQLEMAVLLKGQNMGRARELASKAAGRSHGGVASRDTVARARLVEAEAAAAMGDPEGAARALDGAAKTLEGTNLAPYLRYRQARMLEQVGETTGARRIYSEISRAPNPLLRRLSASSDDYWQLRQRAEHFGE